MEAQNANKKEIENLKAQLKAQIDEKRKKEIPVKPNRQIVRGSVVKVKEGAVDLNCGIKFCSFVYRNTYYVGEVNGERAVIYPNPAYSGPPTAAVSTKSLILIWLF